MTVQQFSTITSSTPPPAPGHCRRASRGTSTPTGSPSPLLRSRARRVGLGEPDRPWGVQGPAQGAGCPKTRACAGPAKPRRARSGSAAVRATESARLLWFPLDRFLGATVARCIALFGGSALASSGPVPRTRTSRVSRVTRSRSASTAFHRASDTPPEPGRRSQRTIGTPARCMRRRSSCRAVVGCASEQFEIHPPGGSTARGGQYSESGVVRDSVLMPRGTRRSGRGPLGHGAGQTRNTAASRSECVGDGGAPRRHAGTGLAHGRTDLRRWIASHGVLPTTHERSRLRSGADLHSQ